MMRIALASPCYKRPRLAKRLLDSVESRDIPITDAYVYLQPEDETPAKGDYRFNSTWVTGKQMHYARARNEVIRLAIEGCNPSLVWLCDDDVYAAEYTHFTSGLLSLAMRPDVGLVALMRHTRKVHQPKDVETWSPTVYFGGGVLFRPEVFQSVNGFSDDSSDERDFSLRVYLQGYSNCFTRRAYARHSVGGGEGGGYAQALEDGETDATIERPRSTQYHEDHDLMRVETAPTYYRGVRYPELRRCCKYLGITDKAKAIHNKNAKARGFG